MKTKKLCECCFCETKEDPCPVCGYYRSQTAGDMSVLPVKTRIGGKFVIGGIIGKGGFGMTYCAYDLNNGRKAAIKEYFPAGAAGRAKDGRTVIPSEEALYSGGMERFLSEAQAVSQFNGNSGIVSVYDCFCENGTAYLSMEYLEGATLEEYIKSRGALTEGQAVYLANRLSVALMLIHGAGLLHRDIAPDNIMICNDGRIKLIDFGAARKLSAECSPKYTVIAKTGFTAAEQYSVNGNYGPWTDIYSVGAVLYYALTGSKPLTPYERMVYDGEFKEKTELINDPQLREIVRRAAGISEPERFKSAEEMKSALGALHTAEEPFSAEGISAVHINAAASGRKTAGRQKGFFAAVTASAASFVLGAAIFAAPWSAEEPGEVLPLAAAEETSSAHAEGIETQAETPAETEKEEAPAITENEPVIIEFDGVYSGNMVFNGAIPCETLKSFGGDVAIRAELAEKPDKQDYECIGFIVTDSGGRNMIKYLSSDPEYHTGENGFINIEQKHSFEFVITRAGIEALDGKDLGFETSGSYVRSVQLKNGRVHSKFVITSTEVEVMSRETIEENGRKAFLYDYSGMLPNNYDRYDRAIPRDDFISFDSDVKVTVRYAKTCAPDGYASLLPAILGVPYNVFARDLFVFEENDEYGFPIAQVTDEEDIEDCWIRVYPPEGEFAFIIRKNLTDRISGGMTLLLNNASVKDIRIEGYEEERGT